MPTGVYIRTKESRKKMSLAQLGKKRGPCSEETKQKNREWHLGKNPWNKGLKYSEDFKSNFKGKKPLRLKGENHYRWIKDRTKLKTDRDKAYDSRYKYWMLEVKKRDGWKCKMNSSRCSGRLEAHHILNWIEYPELRYNINNGITLCRFHHPRKRLEEKKLISFFKDLINLT